MTRPAKLSGKDAERSATDDSAPAPVQTNSGKAFHESASLASWVFGGLILIFLMVVVFVEVNPSKFPIIRFLMALSSTLFAVFFLGGVLLKWTFNGVVLSATGGFVLFVLINFVFDPFKVLPTVANSTSLPVANQPSPAATANSRPTPGATSPPGRIYTTQNVAPANTPTRSSGYLDGIEIRKTLRDAESLIQTGNKADSEKALQLYFAAVNSLKLKHRNLDQRLLAQAENDYAHHYNDNARTNYKALLEAYLRNNSALENEK